MWTVKRRTPNAHGNFFRILWRLQQAKFTTEKTERAMAIRREDINVWERRAPIAPSHVAELVNKGIKVLVQPSTRRAYTMDEYERAGGVITEDLSPASLIIGVKAVPIDLLIPNKTYAFFSHTIKAQEANMPLLDAMLEKVKEILLSRMILQLREILRFLMVFANLQGNKLFITVRTLCQDHAFLR